MRAYMPALLTCGRKQERESWRMEQRHVEAIRDPSELAIAGKEQHGLAPAGLSPSCSLARASVDAVAV